MDQPNNDEKSMESFKDPCRKYEDNQRISAPKIKQIRYLCTGFSTILKYDKNKLSKQAKVAEITFGFEAPHTP